MAANSSQCDATLKANGIRFARESSAKDDSAGASQSRFVLIEGLSPVEVTRDARPTATRHDDRRLAGLVADQVVVRADLSRALYSRILPATRKPTAARNQA